MGPAESIFMHIIEQYFCDRQLPADGVNVCETKWAQSAEHFD